MTWEVVMHTLGFKTADHGEVVVNHNGDWSGEARVAWTVAGKTREVWLPAPLLVALGSKAAAASLSSRVIECIEDWEP